MEPRRPPASRSPDASMPAWREAGAIVRAARLRAGLTLADLGRQCGYSVSQVSRYERGVQPLTDVTLLRRFADLLAIPPEALGLAAANGMHGRRPADINHRACAIDGPSVVPDFRPEDGDDPVRRRELLAG
jgi:transcriptional regulator with XRE-family HTH domain